MTIKAVMKTIKTILEGLKAKHTYREIEKASGASPGLIARVKNAIDCAKKTAEEVLNLEDKEILAIIYPSTKKKRTEPDWDTINTQKSEVSKATILQLYERYCSENEGKILYSYPSFARLYADRVRAERRAKDAITNAVRVPGERMEIDFSGDPFCWTDAEGNEQSVRIFVATLPYSSMIFAYATKDETQASWIAGIIKALEYFGGATKYLVMDNARALVKHANWNESEVQFVIQNLCEHYHMIPQPCKVRSPRQKNRVEAACNDVQRWIFAEFELDGKTYYKDLEALNLAIRAACNKINEREFRDASHDSRRSLFLREEKECLQALPNVSYSTVEWRMLVADKGHCVRLRSDGGHRYSVPPEYKGKTVLLRLTTEEIRVYDLKIPEKPIAIHKRCYNAKGPKTHLLEEHLTEEEKKLRRSSDEFITLFKKVGINPELAKDYVGRVYDNFVGRQQCGALYSLCLKHKKVALLNKCLDKAIKCENLRYSFIKELVEQEEAIANRQGQLDLELDSDPKYKTVKHKNIRNNFK